MSVNTKQRASDQEHLFQLTPLTASSRACVFTGPLLLIKSSPRLLPTAECHSPLTSNLDPRCLTTAISFDHSPYRPSTNIEKARSPRNCLQTANMRSKFKDAHPFEKRKAEAERIRSKYADRIPVSIPFWPCAMRIALVQALPCH